MELLNLGKVMLENMSPGKYLTCTNLTRVELEQLFTTLMAQNHLTDITIESSDLSGVSEDFLAEALSRMRFLELSGTNLTPCQLNALFNLLKDSTELEEIVVSRNILSQVPANHLAMSLSRLRKVKLEYSYLTNEQCCQILTLGK